MQEQKNAQCAQLIIRLFCKIFNNQMQNHEAISYFYFCLMTLKMENPAKIVQSKTELPPELLQLIYVVGTAKNEQLKDIKNKTLILSRDILLNFANYKAAYYCYNNVIDILFTDNKNVQNDPWINHIKRINKNSAKRDEIKPILDYVSQELENICL